MGMVKAYETPLQKNHLVKSQDGAGARSVEGGRNGDKGSFADVQADGRGSERGNDTVDEQPEGLKTRHEKEAAAMKLETLMSMKERRSVRAYQKEQITDAELDAVLEAGTYAASGMNRQPSKMVAVQDAELIAELSRMNAEVMGADSDPFYGAPTVVVVFADTNVGTWLQDGSLVMGNLMLAAYAVGLGSCWINRAREMFESPRGKELMAKWGIADNYAGVACCILGYPEGELPEAKPRKDGYIIKV